MNNKNVLITGSSRGIGRAAALHLASLGYNVAINCVNNPEKLLSLESELKESGIKTCAFQGDVGQYETAKAFYEKTLNELGSVDIVINNAGVSHVGLLQDMTPKQWNDIVTTNVTSVFNMCHLAIPAMVHHKYGKIINISSMWGICGASCEAAYSATKGAVNALTRALGKELAPSNIQVNAVAFGAIDTDMNKCFSDEELAALAGEIPAGRLGRPEEAARIIQMIIEAPAYLNGEVIKMDGGYI